MFASLISEAPDGGVLAWFEGQNVYLSFNARAAIRKACDVIGLKPGDEVLAPAYHCGSEIDPLIDAGAHVALYNVKRNTTVDLDDLKIRVTNQTKAIYVTHYFGFPQPQIFELMRFCQSRNIFLIEDCSLGLFSELDGRKLGTFGDVSIFCFYKYLSTIGGGALLVNNPELGNEVKFDRAGPTRPIFRALAKSILRSTLGDAASKSFVNCAKWSVGKRRRNRERPLDTSRPLMPGDYHFDIRYKDAAMDAVTLRILGSYSVREVVLQRRQNYLRYQSMLRGGGLERIHEDIPECANPLAFPMLVNDRDRIRAALAQNGFEVAPWWKGYHPLFDLSDFATARELKDRLIALPVDQTLDAAELDHISQIVIQCASA